jgi:hypothetical protein
MPGCHEMRLGQVWRCEECGLELEVVAECENAGEPDEQCACHYENEPCSFSCCGKELVLKT